ncbi:MAG: response regulator [Parvibaculum sp.]|nr:response regulator [Parvibaculum sp.]
MTDGRPTALYADPRFRTALRIALTFLLVSYAYLYGSDWLVEITVPVEWLFVVNVSKGFIYVTIVAVGLVYYIHQALIQTQSAEESFKQLINASPDGIVMASNGGHIMMANPAMSEMTGYSRDELIGMTRADLFDETSPDLVRAVEMRKKYGEVRQRVMMHRKADTEIPVMASIKEFGLVNGERRICAIIHELTDEERHEAKYREGERLRLVGHLAGGVAHDFNNLLTVISGNTEILLDLATPGSPQHRAANIILMAGQQAAQLIRHLLAFARRQSLDPAPFSVGARLRELMPLLSKAVGSHVNVELRCPDDVWFAYADAAQFENAVLNLVLNAKDALRQDATIVIEAINIVVGAHSPFEDVLVPGDYVALSVTDHGTGMTPEVLAHAVEPFYSTKETGHGIGLGLSTVFGFAKQSGGHLDIRSEVEQGTTVTFFLPRPVGDHLLETSALPSGEVMGGTERILVVEDDPLVRVFLENALSQLGYKVMTVGDATEALSLLGTHSMVDLLVADVVLPRGMNGRELAAKLKDTHPGLAVLFISGFPDENAGTDDVTASPALKKPFHVQDLAKRIRAALEERGRSEVRFSAANGLPADA